MSPNSTTPDRGSKLIVRAAMLLGVALLPLAWYVIIILADLTAGGNRTASLDSRYTGFVPAQAIFSEPRRVYFSKDPETGEIRWSRVLHRVQ